MCRYKTIMEKGMTEHPEIHVTKIGEMISVADRSSLVGGIFDWLASSLFTIGILGVWYGVLGSLGAGVVILTLTRGVNVVSLDGDTATTLILLLGAMFALWKTVKNGVLQGVVADFRSLRDPGLYLLAGPGGVACALPEFSFKNGFELSHYAMSWGEISAWTQHSGYGAESLIFEGHEGWRVPVSLMAYGTRMEKIADRIQLARSDPNLSPNVELEEHS